ncbi:MAG: ribosome rescue protein RqcH [Candidatus Hodarchaeota archaeon]
MSITPKASMSNIDVAAIATELSPLIKGSWVNNIYQVSNKFLFKFRSREGKSLVLLIEPGYRVHVTNYEQPLPKSPPMFCRALRSRLKRRLLTDIYQYNLDRIMVLKAGQGEDSYTVIIELFGVGNMILVDWKGKIVLAQHYRRMRDRDIILKEQFAFPPKRGKDITELTENDFITIFSSSDSDLARTLVTNLNIGSEYAEEICLRSDLDQSKSAKEVSLDEAKKIYAEILGIFGRVEAADFEPNIVYENETPVNVLPFIFRKYAHLDSKVFSSFNEAADTYFSLAESLEMGEELYDEIDEKKGELLRISEKQREKIAQMQKLAVEYKHHADLIYANFHLIEDLLSRLKRSRKEGYSWGEIIESLNEDKERGLSYATILDRLDASSASAIVSLNDALISLDFRATASENAARLYEKAKKAEAKVRGAKIALEKTLTKKVGLKEPPKEKPIALVKRRSKKWYERFRWFFSSDAFLVIGGRDAKTNEILVKKHMTRQDIFMHANIHGAPAVIVKTEGKNVPEATINQAAEFAASFSRAWNAGLGQIDVYWVNADQVSFSPPSGEYLAKGAIIIKGERNYVRGVPLKLAVGIQFENEHIIPICGPVNAIESQTRVFAVITPGDLKFGQLVKSLKAEMIQKLPKARKERVQAILPTKFQNIIPPGGGQISYS